MCINNELCGWDKSKKALRMCHISTVNLRFTLQQHLTTLFTVNLHFATFSVKFHVTIIAPRYQTLIFIF